MEGCRYRIRRRQGTILRERQSFPHGDGTHGGMCEGGIGKGIGNGMDTRYSGKGGICGLCLIQDFPEQHALCTLYRTPSGRGDGIFRRPEHGRRDMDLSRDILVRSGTILPYHAGQYFFRRESEKVGSDCRCRENRRRIREYCPEHRR